MADDEVGQWNELRSMSRGWNEQKVNGGEGSCFLILFTSDAEAGTWLADGNGFLLVREAILYK